MALSSAGNQVKHMDILKGSIWQIVSEKMLICGKALALPSTGNDSVVLWWGMRVQTAMVCNE